nr:ubiquitin domain-containing protein 7SL RNA2-like [Nicotiana tomentosiformis]
MDLFFQPTKGRPFAIEVGYFDSILEIKEKIQRYQGIPVPKQTLIFKGNVLDDHINVHYSDILNNSHIHLVVESESKFESDKNINIIKAEQSPNYIAASTTTTSSGSSSGNNVNGSKKIRIMVLSKCGTKKIPIEVNPSDNVGHLRKELQILNQKLELDLPKEGYFFIYKQNVMDDDYSFRWHHVSQGDTIEIFNGSVTGGA